MSNPDTSWPNMTVNCAVTASICTSNLAHLFKQEHYQPTVVHEVMAAKINLTCNFQPT